MAAARAGEETMEEAVFLVAEEEAEARHPGTRGRRAVCLITALPTRMEVQLTEETEVTVKLVTREVLMAEAAEAEEEAGAPEEVTEETEVRGVFLEAAEEAEEGVEVMEGPAVEPAVLALTACVEYSISFENEQTKHTINTIGTYA
jgi:hypothetical protein